MNFKPAMIKFFRLTICVLLMNCCFVFSEEEDSKKCPPPEYISPCTCKESGEAEVKCNNLANRDELQAIFDESSDYTFWTFTIQNSSFPYLPSTAVVEKRVRNLFLTDSVMTSLFDRPPSSDNELITINFANCVLRRGFRWELFSKLVHLKKFSVSESDMKKIGQSFVDHFPTGVTSLEFIYTKLNTLHDEAFSKLTELREIYMSHDKITTLKRSMFAPESKLHSINFSSNKISSLPDDFFENMPKLKIVYFASNNIVVLQESVFKKILPQIDHLFLAGDKLICNCEMKWLTTVRKPVYTDAVCNKPPALKGLSIKDLKPNHFAHCE